jgi:hypothetical protein
VINGQADQFDTGTQKLVKLMNTFCNNPMFWNYVCIVFTKYYAGCDDIDRQTKNIKSRAMALDLIREHQGKDVQNQPQLPAFFVDSKIYDTDIETKNQFAPNTFSLIQKNIMYLKVEIEKCQNVLVDHKTYSNTRVQTYEDQEREKRTASDGKTITHTEWKSTLNCTLRQHWTYKS